MWDMTLSEARSIIVGALDASQTAWELWSGMLRSDQTEYLVRIQDGEEAGAIVEELEKEEVV